MQWQLYFTDEKPLMAVFVSESSHCIYDIFSRYFSDEWFVEIPAILSNHRTHEALAQKYDIPFYHFPMSSENKADYKAGYKAVKEYTDFTAKLYVEDIRFIPI